MSFTIVAVSSTIVQANQFPIVNEAGENFETEDAYWKYLESNYPSVTTQDIRSGDYTNSYVILNMVAKNVDIDPSIEYITCDMYCDKGDNTYHKLDLWCTFYGDKDLKDNGFVCGKDYLVGMKNDDLLRCCCYVNSDDSYGASNMLAIKKIGTADESMKFTESIYFTYKSSVPNDVTGKWRLSTTSTSFDIASYALNYYKTYFKSDDEIHAVINKSNGTTSSLSVVAGQLNVTVHRYIDEEENDAKILFSGDVISQYYIDMNTGEVSKV